MRKKLLEAMRSNEIKKVMRRTTNNIWEYEVGTTIAETERNYETVYELEAYLRPTTTAFTKEPQLCEDIKDRLVRSLMRDLYGDIQDQLINLHYQIQYGNKTNKELADLVETLLLDIGGIYE